MQKHVQHYDESCDFLCLFSADEFDEEVETDERWMGFVRNEQGLLELAAEYVYDGEGEDSGTGWWL